MLDIDVPTVLLGWATITATGEACDELCEATLGPFSGAELLAELLGRDMTDVPRMTAGWQPVPVGDALIRRGAAVINGSGRVGVTLGHGVVVEPAGRIWALTTDPDRWIIGLLIPGMVYTMVLS